MIVGVLLLAYFGMAAIVARACLHREPRPVKFWWSLWYALTWPWLFLSPPPKDPKRRKP